MSSAHSTVQRHVHVGALILVLGLFCIGACSGPTELILSVNVLPSGTERLRVRTILNGTRGTDSFVEKGASRFVVQLPDGAAGSVDIEVSALDGVGCKISTGSTSQSVPTGIRRYAEASIDLTQNIFDPHRCILTVSAHGQGKVTSSPDGIDCSASSNDRCEADYDFGTAVRLDGYAAPRHYTTWNPSCKGLTFCDVTLDRSIELQAGFPSRSCSADGWCWQHPLPTGSIINWLWGTSEKDIWAVGTSGTILHWDGYQWDGFDALKGYDLNGVWGSRSDDVWVVGKEGTILHWNGSKWDDSYSMDSMMGLGKELTRVWGANANDVWVVGAGGLILHWDGSSWLKKSTAEVSERLTAVWGSAADDVWIVGIGGLALHGNGKTWMKTTTATKKELRSVAGTGPNDVWAVGSEGTIQHWTGAQWTDESLNTTDYLAAVWAHAPNDAWVVGQSGSVRHWNGVAWTKSTSSVEQNLWSVWGANTTDYWAAGEHGAMVHWDGSAWSKTSSSLMDKDLRGISGSSANDVWVVGDEGIALHWDGRDWTGTNTGTDAGGNKYQLLSVWENTPNDVWAVGSKGVIMRWLGSSWKTVQTSDDNDQLRAIWGNGQGDIWTVGYGTSMGSIKAYALYSSDGMAWKPLSVLSINYLYSLWGIGKEVFAVGGDDATMRGFLLRGNNAEIKAIVAQTIPQHLFGVWGTNASDYWAVGDQGVAVNIVSSLVAIDSRFPLYSVWGSSANDVWTVGESGTIGRWNGTRWSASSAGTFKHLYKVWGSGPKDVWSVGGYGTILRYEPR